MVALFKQRDFKSRMRNISIHCFFKLVRVDASNNYIINENPAVVNIESKCSCISKNV